jgi:hypothetical protein
VTISDGRAVEQDFRADLPTGAARVNISRSQPPRLIAPSGETLGTITVAAKPAPTYSAPQTASSFQTSAAEPRNPTVSVGAGVALLGGALVLVGAFLPIRSYANLPIPNNSFVSDGDWWILALPVLIGVAALYFLLGAGRVLLDT